MVVDRTVAVITGGAGGMGLATAKIIGRDHHLLLSDIGQDRLDRATSELAALGISCDSIACDVADRDAVGRLAARAAELGTVVCAVHAAGVSPQMGAAEMILRINAIGTINVTEAFLDLATEGFRLVNVASMAAYLSPGLLLPTRSYRYAMTDRRRFLTSVLRRCRMAPAQQRSGIAYSISKHFVVWYSKQMAPSFGAKGARIVSVSPGSFDTPMGALEAEHGAADMLRFASLKRFGKVDEIAELLAFCASDKPGYLTGADILCDGGVVAGASWRQLLSLARRGR
jgi:NAD(P)-dependent dehydrogenase (short-subunit alcohol dehydrogenase family)